MQVDSNIAGCPPSSEIIYTRLFNFIDSVLPGFNVLNKTKDGDLVVAEDDITEDLGDYLDSKQESLRLESAIAFRFTNLSLRKTDIGVKFGRNYSANNRKPFCWIEAKRLPTPQGKNRDEREYVIVSQEKIDSTKKFDGNGGIQRFKENKHADGLPSSIMIGYIQDNNSADYWLTKINGWIMDLVNANVEHWSQKDCLNRYPSNKCNRFLSTHKRKDETTITLHHYWIKL
jgi:hypothetical protein